MTHSDIQHMRHQALDKIALKLTAGSCNVMKFHKKLPTTDASVAGSFHPRIYSQMPLSGLKVSSPDKLVL